MLFRSRDIPLWLNTTVKELLTENGRVVGALMDREGSEIRVLARRGVLLATGGFAQNGELRQEVQQAPAGSKWTAASPGATGDGIALGREVGAGTALMECAWWTPTYTLPDGRNVALIAGKAYPGSIMVNAQGRRFANEAQPYEDLVKAQYASQARGEGAIPCYLVFDGSFRRRYALGHIKPGRLQDDRAVPADYFSSGLLTRADSLRELATQLQIDAGALEATVVEFNRHAREGRDPAFGRGDSQHDRYYADHRVLPNPSLGP